LGDQFQRDENAKTLLEAIREAFEFGNEADVLRKIEPGSVPAKTLNRMLQCITDCANVIESSAFMGRVGMSC
jgi:crotonobetainyl-CoA:carnitine CoA-transferase CaiB-like acyl-CoA transferase